MRLDIHLAPRVEAAAHGGQIVMTCAMHDAIGGVVTTESPGFVGTAASNGTEKSLRLRFDPEG